jgi:helix-turn-helix protein
VGAVSNGTTATIDQRRGAFLTMGARHPNARRVKSRRTYTVDEIARLFELHKNTVHRWLKNGLAAIDGRRPTLVRGAVLSAFVTKRKQASKRPCPPGFMYCLRCRAPKPAANRKADYVPITTIGGNLRANCADCRTLMFRGTNWAKIEFVRGDLDLTFPEDVSRLTEKAVPSPYGAIQRHSEDEIT